MTCTLAEKVLAVHNLVVLSCENMYSCEPLSSDPHSRTSFSLLQFAKTEFLQVQTWRHKPSQIVISTQLPCVKYYLGCSEAATDTS